MYFEVKFVDPRLESFLRVRDALVVDGRADLLQKEAEQATRSYVADLLAHVLLEVPFDGRYCLLTAFLGEFDHGGTARVRGRGVRQS